MGSALAPKSVARRCALVPTIAIVAHRDSVFTEWENDIRFQQTRLQRYFGPDHSQSSAQNEIRPGWAARPQPLLVAVARPHKYARWPALCRDFLAQQCQPFHIFRLTRHFRMAQQIGNCRSRPWPQTEPYRWKNAALAQIIDSSIHPAIHWKIRRVRLRAPSVCNTMQRSSRDALMPSCKLSCHACVTRAYSRALRRQRELLQLITSGLQCKRQLLPVVLQFL
jgi:hypothetical protein